MNRLAIIFFGGSEGGRTSSIRHLGSTGSPNGNSHDAPYAGGFFERDARGYVTESEAIERKYVDPGTGHSLTELAHCSINGLLQRLVI